MTIKTTTTDLSIIRKRPGRFTWGKIIRIHDIGPYTIVEYTRKAISNPALNEVRHHAYVDGEDTCNSAFSLDGALLIALGRKHCEVNEGRFMAMAAAKLFGIK